MVPSGQVHWHEGLFLQPHHLQCLQRGLWDGLATHGRLAWAYPYGVVEAALSGEDLQNLRIRFNRLRVVMPSGLEVNVPETADLHTLDVREAFEASGQPLTVSLGVPQYTAEGANAVEDGGADAWRTNRRYLVAEVEQPDENTGDNPQPVRVRRVNARLLLEGDDRTDLEALPLLRLAHVEDEGQGRLKLDEAFAPPCLLLRGSNVLNGLAQSVAGEVEKVRNDLAAQIIRGGFNPENLRGKQLEMWLRLRTLNRHDAVLRHAVRAPSVTPFAMYLQLRELLGELAALRPDQHDALLAVPDYDHDAPALCFKELRNNILAAIKIGPPPQLMKVPFAYVEADRAFVAQLLPEHLSKPNEYFLGIKTRQDPRALAELVEDQVRFKFMPRTLRNRAIFGVKLEREMSQAPPGFPIEVGLHYFRLVRRGTSPVIWDQIKQEKAIAVVFPGTETTDFAMTLYMTVPEEGTAR